MDEVRGRRRPPDCTPPQVGHKLGGATVGTIGKQNVQRREKKKEKKNTSMSSAAPPLTPVREHSSWRRESPPPQERPHEAAKSVHAQRTRAGVPVRSVRKRISEARDSDTAASHPPPHMHANE